MKCFRRQWKAMGSPCELQVFAAQARSADAAIRRVVEDVERLERKYSRFRKESFLSEINRCAARGGRLEVDDETASLLDYAEACHGESEGLFDVTSGPLRRAWNFESGELPEAGELRALLGQIGWHRLRWQRPVLEFATAGMELDFGGIVKEYAADRAAVLCRDAGTLHGMVNLGGDIRIVGPQPDGGAWKIGIRHPRQPGRLIGTVALTEGGLASSGDYERCVEVAGVRYGHVLNPKTGWPVRGLASVSVAAPLCVIAGSASTIAMLREDDGPDWLDGLGLAYRWVDVEGRTGGSRL